MVDLTMVFPILVQFVHVVIVTKTRIATTVTIITPTDLVHPLTIALLLPEDRLEAMITPEVITILGITTLATTVIVLTQVEATITILAVPTQAQVLLQEVVVAIVVVVAVAVRQEGRLDNGRQVVC